MSTPTVTIPPSAVRRSVIRNQRPAAFFCVRLGVSPQRAAERSANHSDSRPAASGKAPAATLLRMISENVRPTVSGVPEGLQSSA